MALCGGGGVGAMALPSELIVHIFSFLPERDKLRASAVCSRWRECLFYPALWTELRLRVRGGGSDSAAAGDHNNPRLEFLMRKFGSFVRELQLELAPADPRLPAGGGPASPASAADPPRLPPVEDSSRPDPRLPPGGAPVEGCLGPLSSSSSSSRGPGGGGGAGSGTTGATPTPGGPPDSPWPPPRWKDAMDGYLEQLLCVLSSIRNNRNLQKLSLYGDTCVLQEEGVDSSGLDQIHHGDKKIKEIQQMFRDLLSNSRQMTWLSCSFMLGLLTPCSLACLSNASADSLQHLSLMDHQLAPLISPVELGRLSSLRSLALDFSDLTSSLCHLLADPRRAPLHRLSLLLNGQGLEFKPLDGTASEDDWKALMAVSSNLRVYLMALEVDTADLLRVLKPSLPLQRLHLDSYGTAVSAAALELISTQYNRTLTHFLLMRDDCADAGSGGGGGGGTQDFPDLSGGRNEDPLVLLAWRCTQLAVLVVHGYIVFSHNLVAISRLRGSSLRVLSVSEESIDFDPEQVGGGGGGGGEEEGEGEGGGGDPVHHLVKEVSLGLGRAWHPCLDSSLVLAEPTAHFHRELQAFSAGL